MEELSRREGLLRREWAAKTRAAEWALKAHRDKQVGNALIPCISYHAAL